MARLLTCVGAAALGFGVVIAMFGWKGAAISGVVLVGGVVLGWISDSDQSSLDT